MATALTLSAETIRLPPQVAGRLARGWMVEIHHFLQAVARFPRQCLTDRYFLRGLHVEEDEILEAMDVCGDAICQALDERKVGTRAKEDLWLLDYVGNSPAPTEKRCGAILSLIHGRQHADIVKELEEAGEDQ